MSPEQVAAEAVSWRRHLHRHPELSFEEVETSAFVEERLRCFEGIDVSRPTATSVMGRLVGGSGPTIALRADLDALPIQEESGVEFASTHPGVMHACGHDVHTAVLLAVARRLSERRAEIPGEVRFLFQHAEELPPGGARELVVAGALEGVDAIVGAHVLSDLEVGRVAAPVGLFMASPDTFAINVTGLGGHAAAPHDAIDPVVAAAEIVVNLQQIVARELNPARRAVLSTTRIAGGTAYNIIPELVELGGTVRTFEPEVRDQVREALERVATNVARAHRCSATVSYTEGYAPVVNDAAVAELVAAAAGTERLVELEPIMAGEDFSAYQQLVPGCFFFVGAGGPGSFPHHHPRFTIDEAAIPVAIDVFERTVGAFFAAG